MNYLTDESCDIGKGPNCVISFLHHYLETNSSPEMDLVLFSDNCVGQNKNNAMLGYLMWRMSKKLNKSISLNFLLTGHTKFSPDRFFGIFKSKYALSNIDNHEDLVNCVVASSHSGHNKAVSANDVTWYNWTSYVNQFYKPLIGITSYHHFKILSDGVEARSFADSENCVELKLQLAAVNDEMPEILIPEGLSLERKWYMFNNLRDLVHDKKKADSLAPEPEQKLRKGKTATKKVEKTTTQKRKAERKAEPVSKTSTPKKQKGKKKC